MTLGTDIGSSLRIAAAAAMACFVAGNAAANPTGMQVVAGKVSTATSVINS